MSHRLNLALAFVLSTSALFADAEGGDISPHNLIQGMWRAQECQIDGRSLPSFAVADMTITFDGDNFSQGPSTEVLRKASNYLLPLPIKLETKPIAEAKQVFRLDTSRTPNILTICRLPFKGAATETNNEEVASECRFALEGNILTICWGMNKRPDSLFTKPGDNCMRLVYKRTMTPERFRILVNRWTEHCWWSKKKPQRCIWTNNVAPLVIGDPSISDDKYFENHPAYQELVRCGKPAVPFIMRQIDSENWYQCPWEFALDEVTGLHYIRNRKDYIDLWVRQNYLDWWRKAHNQYDE